MTSMMCVVETEADYSGNQTQDRSLRRRVLYPYATMLPLTNYITLDWGAATE